MAPFFNPRQFHSLPPPRPPKGPPGIPIRVKTYIGLTVFIQLFAGTFCIFIIGVLVWKIGKFLRHLTQGKVVGEGHSPDTRYVRTWYGWVPLQRHEANKEAVRRAYEKYHRWTDWKSSRDDYRWIWWDPGQKEMEKYYQNRRPLRWVPRWLRSYKPIAADTIWNPGPPPTHVVSDDRKPEHSCEAVEGSACEDDARHVSDSVPVLPDVSSRNDRQRQRAARTRFSSIALVTGRELVSNHNFAYKRSRWSQSSHLLLEKGRLFWTLNNAKRPPKRASIFSEFSTFEPRNQRCVSLPCLAVASVQPRILPPRTDTSWESEISIEQGIQKTSMPRHCSRKYQIWSTKMQIQPSGLIKHKQCGFLGPPGSPRSELLTSFVSRQHTTSESLPFVQERGNNLSFESSNHGSSSIGTSYFTARSTLTSQATNFEKRWNSTPFLCSQSLSLSPTGNALTRRYGFCSLRNVDRLSSFLQEMAPKAMPQRTGRQTKPDTTKAVAIRSRQCSSVQLDHLNDWEVRLMNNLDRKLEWLLSELDPGRRPFHFATLANHWLNRETWIVIDPISRVPIDARRQWGDPRFNVPYPTQTYKPTPKYPVVVRKRAHTPKINSWRIAVNRQRRASGLKDIVKAVELFDDPSADDPPDGKVDPASWILRKPPQGFAMSAKHENTYYEGGAGWQETFSDWQKVRRGYRIRKAVYEGRVNRNRVKHLARGITRYYRTSSPKNSTG